MSTEARTILAAFTSISHGVAISAVMVPMFAYGDFSGGDSLKAPNEQWNYFQEGGGSFVSQNSRLEYIVSSPANLNAATLFWVANQGSYIRNWYLQVDTDLAWVSLTDDAGVSLSLRAGNSSDGTGRQLAGIYSERYQVAGKYSSLISGNTDWGFYHSAKSSARFVTLRLHFDSKDKTITGSWNPGTGWKYLPPQSIARWGMSNSDRFYAFLYAANFGPATDYLHIESGSAHFRNFKAGAAKPDIAVEQPARNDLTDGRGARSFGNASVGIGRVTKAFTIRNTGTARLEGLKIANTGANPVDFTIIPPTKTTVLPGASTTFKVIFKPKASGARNTIIHISSNDPNESPFDIRLAGRGVK